MLSRCMCNSPYPPLQLVSELDIGRCANEDVESQRGVDFEIPHRLKRGTSASEDEILSVLARYVSLLALRF